MLALIDSDILQYEVAFAAESRLKFMFKEQEREPDGSPPPYSWIPEMVDERVNAIMQQSECVGEPIMLFTGPNNFRFNIAFTQPYKERDDAKPYHHANVKTYIESKYRCLEREGLEADDLIGMMMTKYPGKYMCCSRDKDLRQIPGWHFGWELHKQPQFGPMEIDEYGFLELRQSGKRKFLVGGGDKFFYSQLLTGDSTDDIPGCDGIGPVGAYEILKDCRTSEDCFEAVRKEYQHRYGLYYPEYLLEQGRLLRMVRSLEPDGMPTLWNPSLF